MPVGGIVLLGAIVIVYVVAAEPEGGAAGVHGSVARLGEPAIPPARLAAAARPPDRKLERIVVKDGARVHIIRMDRLDYIEAQDDYISLHSDGGSYLKQQTISGIEEQLDPARFIRIHRSYIVNLERIVRVEPYSRDSRVVILRDGAQIPVSRSGIARLKAVLPS